MDKNVLLLSSKNRFVYKQTNNNNIEIVLLIFLKYKCSLKNIVGGFLYFLNKFSKLVISKELVVQ